MYMLSEHPHVVKRLRADILLIVGPDRRPTFQQISELKYLRAFVNGSLSTGCLELADIYFPSCRDIALIPLRVSTLRSCSTIRG